MFETIDWKMHENVLTYQALNYTYQFPLKKHVSFKDFKLYHNIEETLVIFNHFRKLMTLMKLS